MAVLHPHKRLPVGAGAFVHAPPGCPGEEKIAGGGTVGEPVDLKDAVVVVVLTSAMSATPPCTGKVQVPAVGGGGRAAPMPEMEATASDTRVRQLSGGVSQGRWLQGEKSGGHVRHAPRTLLVCAM